jgi:hypothetical protein
VVLVREAVGGRTSLRVTLVGKLGVTVDGTVSASLQFPADRHFAVPESPSTRKFLMPMPECYGRCTDLVWTRTEGSQDEPADQVAPGLFVVAEHVRDDVSDPPRWAEGDSGHITNHTELKSPHAHKQPEHAGNLLGSRARWQSCEES